MSEPLKNFKIALDNELKNILDYWMQHTPDNENGGFYGKIDHDDKVYESAEKGVVLNARILWSFAAAYIHTGNALYLEMALRAFNYIVKHFVDKECGGVYWSVDYKGNPLDTKKQVYALSFALYAFAEYYKCTNNETAKELAIAQFELIEKYSRDKELGGYIEAFTQDWQPIEDLRLSDKDANEKKTMNTHLHILEAYSNLYRIHPKEEVADAIKHLLQVFDGQIIDAGNSHLILFFDEQWNRRRQQVSYGHDIEAAWLLLEAAETIMDKEWINTMKWHAIEIAKAAAEGLDADGGMWHEYNAANNHWVREKHWWPAAEAMVGFMNAWQVGGNEKFLHLAINSWRFIESHIIDKKHGEWVWGVNADYGLMAQEDKVGFWKCPYHNSRACMEVSRRLSDFV